MENISSAFLWPLSSFLLLLLILYIIIRGRFNLSFILVRPRWTVEPTDKQFAQGSDAKIDCKADGFPQPKITWKKAVGKIFLVQIITFAVSNTK